MKIFFFRFNKRGPRLLPGGGKLKKQFKRITGHYRYHTLLAAGIFFLAVFYCLAVLSPVAAQGSAHDIVVTIPSMATAGQVGKILKESDLVRSHLAFSLYARWKGLDSRIKAGEYGLNNGLSTPQVLMELVNGHVDVQSFTVPEGFTTAQVADLLAAKGLISKEKFYAVVAGEDLPYPFIQDLPEGDKRLEGYLFPDTYQMMRGDSEGSVVNMMLKRFEIEMDDLDYPAQAEMAGVTLHQAVTIASLVEREARIDEERPVIAGVIYNRMDRSMPLQLCATVQYALGVNKPELYYKDLEIDSPYNTYLIQGLPPGPIAMPGRTSLLAAVHPARTDYLYYVVKPDGAHAFATTLEEHEANIERYRQ